MLLQIRANRKSWKYRTVMNWVSTQSLSWDKIQWHHEHCLREKLTRAGRQITCLTIHVLKATRCDDMLSCKTIVRKKLKPEWSRHIAALLHAPMRPEFVETHSTSNSKRQVKGCSVEKGSHKELHLPSIQIHRVVLRLLNYQCVYCLLLWSTFLRVRKLYAGLHATSSRPTCHNSSKSHIT